MCTRESFVSKCGFWRSCAGVGWLLASVAFCRASAVLRPTRPAARMVVFVLAARCLKNPARPQRASGILFVLAPAPEAGEAEGETTEEGERAEQAEEAR